ncbi:MAG TPA: histidine phosphatase family protein [Rhodocyclaceae bacterium]|nr:histidine phosphatase family protein [Rhodocyclaceae bacterium]HRQ46851.1 histidine phosphatase family protein [Rhodocyclaceae bacterium]
METTRICLVRHGETAWNAERRLQGHLDVALNDTGRRQAAATAAALKTHTFDAVYCSDLSRARMTAAVVASSIDREAVPDPIWRERHYGAFQGLTYAEADARFPHDYRRFVERDTTFAFAQGGESLLAFHARVCDGLDKLVQRHSGCSVLLVTHGGVLDMVYRVATGKPLRAQRDFEIPNAAVNWVGFDDGRWHLIAWADRRHLDLSLDELPNA